MFTSKNKVFAVTSANHKHGNQFTAQVDGELIDLEGDRGIGLVVIDYHTRNEEIKRMNVEGKSGIEDKDVLNILVCKAAQQGSIDCLQELMLLEDKNCGFHEYMTPPISIAPKSINKETDEEREVCWIHFAGQSNSKETIDYLLNHGFNINKRNTNRENIFFIAVQSENVSFDFLNYLIEKEVNINTVMKKGKSLLHCAVDYLINSIVDFNVPNSHLQIQNENGMEITKYPVLEYLLGLGIDPKLRDSRHQSIFEYTNTKINLEYEFEAETAKEIEKIAIYLGSLFDNPKIRDEIFEDLVRFSLKAQFYDSFEFYYNIYHKKYNVDAHQRVYILKKIFKSIAFEGRLGAPKRIIGKLLKDGTDVNGKVYNIGNPILFYIKTDMIESFEINDFNSLLEIIKFTIDNSNVNLLLADKNGRTFLHHLLLHEDTYNDFDYNDPGLELFKMKTKDFFDFGKYIVLRSLEMNSISFNCVSTNSQNVQSDYNNETVGKKRKVKSDISSMIKKIKIETDEKSKYWKKLFQDNVLSSCPPILNSADKHGVLFNMDLSNRNHPFKFYNLNNMEEDHEVFSNVDSEEEVEDEYGEVEEEEYEEAAEEYSSDD